MILQCSSVQYLPYSNNRRTRIPKMSRLLLGVIIAVVAEITSLEGLPTEYLMSENPMSNKDQVMEVHEDHREDEKSQRLAPVIAVGDIDQTTGRVTDLASVDTCTGILSHAQLQDIQFQQSDQLYVVINGQLVSRGNPFDLYIEMFKIVRHMAGANRAINIWLSRAPCSKCIGYLEMIFVPFKVKPVLYVESLNYKGSKFDLLRDLGCLAKLTTRNYQLKAWDWDVFRATYGGSCDYLSTTIHNTKYMTQKNYTKTLVDHVEGNLMISSLAKLCDF